MKPYLTPSLLPGCRIPPPHSLHRPQATPVSYHLASPLRSWKYAYHHSNGTEYNALLSLVYATELPPLGQRHQGGFCGSATPHARACRTTLPASRNPSPTADGCTQVLHMTTAQRARGRAPRAPRRRFTRARAPPPAARETASASRSRSPRGTACQTAR